MVPLAAVAARLGGWVAGWLGGWVDALESGVSWKDHTCE